MDPADALQRLYDRVNDGDIASLRELLAEDFVEHEETPGLEPTREGTIEFFLVFRAAFPDLRMTIEDLLVSGDRAVARGRVTGTHRGDFMGIPASGRAIDAALIDIIRFDDDGLALEHWGVLDALAMMQQLGAVPPAA